jgi:phosphoglycolate phosphatase
MGLVQFGDHAFDADLIAFDKDGTLFDFGASLRPRFLAGVERLVASLPGQSVIRAALYRTLGYDPATGAFDERGPFATSTSAAIGYAVTTVLFQHTAPQQDWAACERLVLEQFAPMFSGTHSLVPTTNLAALFSSLHEIGVKIAVITNDDRSPTESVLAHFALSAYVDFIASGDGPARHKPAPDALLAASQRLSVSLKRTAVVGDAVTDLRMAHAAGAGLRVGVLTGVGSYERLAPSADLILASIAEIRCGATPER